MNQSPTVQTNRVPLIGIDFGSTTSSAMVAMAGVETSSATGRMTFGAPCVVYRSEPVFTPFVGNEIDQDRLSGYLDMWLAESRLACEDVFAGGIIVTGLAAEQANASVIARLIGQRIGEAVFATANDPCLESWLAFMGSCGMLSRCHPQKRFINLDIGGGTTNPALGMNGTVIETGCYFIGARHFQFDPGTYRLCEISSYGHRLLEHLSIRKTVGDTLDRRDTDAILDFYIDALTAIVSGDERFFSDPSATLYQQVPFAIPAGGSPTVVTFSGGVGELIYRRAAGEPFPGTTCFGDLGVDLARRILDAPLLSAHVNDLVPENMGRATVYGLALHSTEVSGTTIFLSQPDLLPCRDLPVVARISTTAPADSFQTAMDLVTASRNGGCIQVVPASAAGGSQSAIPVPPSEDLATIKTFGHHLVQAIQSIAPPRRKPLVLLVSQNFGQALGNYVSNWRQSPVDLVVIDEIADRPAHFVNIGRPRNNVVPVSFYGVY